MRTWRRQHYLSLVKLKNDNDIVLHKNQLRYTYLGIFLIFWTNLEQCEILPWWENLLFFQKCHLRFTFVRLLHGALGVSDLPQGFLHPKTFQSHVWEEILLFRTLSLINYRILCYRNIIWKQFSAKLQVAYNQAPHCEKKEKKSANEASREVVGGRRWRAFAALSSSPGYRSPIFFYFFPFFPFFPHCGAWSQAKWMKTNMVAVSNQTGKVKPL